MGNFANIEDPDEMQHNAAFHQGLRCLLRLKQPSGTEVQHNLEISTSYPLNAHNGLSHAYCINIYGKAYQNTKG